MPIIALMSDFGTRDHYVAAMKGVIYQINPKATVVDITHDVPPHDRLHGAFVLRQTLPYFPEKTIFVAVVDPGVGSARHILAARYNDRFVICPDNGLLTFKGTVTLTGLRGFHTDSDAVFEGNIGQTATAGILKRGLATLTLAGNSTYTGKTDIDAGTLLVNGTHTGGGAYTVNGGTLGGTGTISASVNVGAATLSPGASIGTLTTGALTLGGASNSLFELSAPWQFGVSAGSTPNDLVSVTGNLALDGTLTVDAVNPLSSGIYTLFTATGSISGDFQSLSLPGGYGGWITIDSGSGAVNLNLVPEPSTLAMLLGLGGLGLLGYWRRRRS